MMNISNQTPAIQDMSTPTSSQPTQSYDISQNTPLPVASPTIAPDTSNGWILALAGVLILLLCIVGAAGVWYFFFR